MRYLQTYLLSALLLLCPALYAQLISGKVISERGLKAAGISVSFKNKSNLVVTNPDGSFKIMATALPDTLVFAAEGYEPYKVVVTEKTVKDPNFEIVLLEERAKHTMSEYRDMAAGGSRDDRALRSMIDGGSYASAAPAAHPSLRKGSGYKKTAAGAAGRTASTAGMPASLLEYDSDGRPGALARKVYSSDTTIPLKDVTRRSQLLSAGEVNDFKKWKMWEDYNTSEFESYSRRWQLFPTGRYSIQLQNKEHTEVVGQPVFLINTATKDTVWKAISDNTGKAELWSGFNKKDSNATYIIATKGESNLSSPSQFSNGMNRMQLNKSCNTSNKVEIAFVVDATGSMSDEIEYLKLELEDVIKNTFEKNSSLDLNVGSVFYRDAGDEYVTKHLNFQPDLLKVLNFIKLQFAAGGGDYPEAVHSALRTAIDSMSWSADARSRILFLFMDAPPHDEARAEMFELMQKAAAKGIRVVPVACSGTDKSTEFIMRSIALATNGTYLFLTDHSGIGGSHIKPTTDAFNVELLNTLLQRTIEQMMFVHPCHTTTAIEEPYKSFENINSIKLYPNPTRGDVSIEISKPLKEAYLTDFTGKILMRINVKDKTKKVRIDLSQYPSATYFIRYITEDDRWGSEKVVLIH